MFFFVYLRKRNVVKKIVFTLYQAAGSLELAQKLKVVKNFEKKKDFRGAS